MLMRETGVTDTRNFNRVASWIAGHDLVTVTTEDSRERGRGTRTFYGLVLPPTIAELVPVLAEGARSAVEGRPIETEETAGRTAVRTAVEADVAERPRSSSDSEDLARAREVDLWLTRQGIGYCEDPMTFREEAEEALGVNGEEVERLLERARERLHELDEAGRS
jgi:hypothetical protein